MARHKSDAGMRLARLGLNPGLAPYCWLFMVYREDYRGEEIIRIISARATEKHEIRRYQEQEVD
jgi:uncharacterized DUF497 family protein